MAAPTPASSVGTPAGIKLDNGHAMRVYFARDPDFSLWEKSVKLPPLDGGDPVDTTTMRNTLWRTKGPRALIDTGEMTFTAAYDPDSYNQARELLNKPDTITVFLPDGSKLAFYGYMQKFEPNDNPGDGEQPEASVTIIPTNFDHVNKVEAGPVLTSVSGT